MGRGGRAMFLDTIAPDIPMSPGRFPVGMGPSWKAGLISMARHVSKNIARPPRPIGNAPLWAGPYRVQEAAGPQIAGTAGAFVRVRPNCNKNFMLDADRLLRYYIGEAYFQRGFLWREQKAVEEGESER